MAFKTALDEFRETGELPRELRDKEVVQAHRLAVPRVRCRCKRMVTLDLLVFVEGVYMCDGCQERMRRREGLTRRQLTDRIGGGRGKGQGPRATHQDRIPRPERGPPDHARGRK